MDDRRRLLRHFMAALAYRTQKALRGAPPEFAAFRPADQARTPHELVNHMNSVLGYATTFFLGGSYREAPLPGFAAEVERFHSTLATLARLVAETSEWRAITPERLLQGPLSDAMTHAGQLAMLRRLAGSPVPPEDFVFADVDASNLGPDQPPPARPDADWPERPGTSAPDPRRPHGGPGRGVRPSSRRTAPTRHGGPATPGRDMSARVALLRAVNVAGHATVAMAGLRELLTRLGFADVRSLLASGNLVFRGAAPSGAELERLLEVEAAARLGLVTDFFVRTADEWSAVVAGNPFPRQAAADPGHLVVAFCKDAPPPAAVEALGRAITGPETVQAKGRALYAVYPEGVGRSRLTTALIERTLGTRVTGRNWNTVLKLAALVGA